MNNLKYDIPFTKVVGSGNDFIVLDDIVGDLGTRGFDYKKIAIDLCRRNISVGADGVLVLESSGKADFRMRIINPDGSEVTMCGNGARCSALYAYQKGMGEKLSFETGAGLLQAEIKFPLVKLKMSDPKGLKLDINIGLGKNMMGVHFIDTGVPHVVHIVEGIKDYPVKETGRNIREHSEFAPDGTNVNFIEVLPGNNYIIRTYERGVEDETLACGTGTVAAAIILGVLGHAGSPVKIKTKSGEELTVYYEKSGNKVKNVFLEGSANIVYEGRV